MEYNTKEGIEAQLGSYAAFYAVMQERFRRGYDTHNADGSRNEEHGKLTPFTVLGSWYSSAFGFCSRLNRELFTDHDRAMMAPVMTAEEFQTFFNFNIEQRITDTTAEPLYQVCEGVIGMTPEFLLPPPHLVCAHCGKTWDLETCYDIEVRGYFEKFDLTPFAGKTSREAQKEIFANSDALREISDPFLLENAQNDLKEHDLDEKTMDYRIAQGDHVNLTRFDFYHGSCLHALQEEYLIEEKLQLAREIIQMFEQCGFEDVRITEAPLPENIRAWFAQEDEGESFEELSAGIMYFNIETKQGSLGIGSAAFPFIDLTKSGVPLSEFEPELATELAAESEKRGIVAPPIVGLKGEQEQLLFLWQLMVKHRGYVPLTKNERK